MNSSLRRISTIAAAVAIAIVLVGYVALLRPQSHDLAVAHKAHAAAEAKVAQLDSQVASLQALVRQKPADTARLKSLDAGLPNNPSLDTVLIQLQQAATATGTGLSSVEPTTPVPATGAGVASSPATTPGGPTISLTISAGGSYPQLTSFLRAITSMPRELVIDHLSISGTSALTATIGARIFYAGSPTP